MKRNNPSGYSLMDKPCVLQLSLYFLEIRQRVHSYYCHLQFECCRFTSAHTMLGVLTNKLYLLSKPVTPIVVTGAVASRLSMELRRKDNAKKRKTKTKKSKNF